MIWTKERIETCRSAMKLHRKAGCGLIEEYTDGLCDLALKALRTEALAPAWRDPKDKPPHLPGEHHSEDVLLQMKPDGIDGTAIRVGHVSCGHWRPGGGNGNFDDDVLGWMPLPAPMNHQFAAQSEGQK